MHIRNMTFMTTFAIILVIAVFLLGSAMTLPALAGEISQPSPPAIGQVWDNFMLLQPTESGIIHPLILPSTADIRQMVEKRLKNYMTTMKIRRADTASESVRGGHYAVILPMSVGSALVVNDAPMQSMSRQG